MQFTHRVPRTRALALLLFAGILVQPFVAPAAARAAVPQPPKGWSRQAVIANAKRWVAQGVPYSQTNWYRGYRQDCSGFVSMAWNLHASYPTGMMGQIARPIPKSALQPGDVLLNNTGTGAHVVLFERWSGPGQRYYIGYEQLSSTDRPVRRLIPYPYFRNTSRYHPYRFTGLPSKPPAKPAPKPKTPPTPAPAPRTAFPTLESTQAMSGVARTFSATAFALTLTLAGAAGLGWGLSGRGSG